VIAEGGLESPINEREASAHSARRGTVRSPEFLTARRAGLRCALGQCRASLVYR
jgi:hypothetical protein